MTEQKDVRHVVNRLVVAVCVLAISCVLALASTVVAIKMASSQDPVVLSIDNSGVLIKQVAVSKPYLDEGRVSAFAEECLRLSFQHDFEHYEQTIRGAMSCYTDAAGSDFADRIDPLIKEIKDKRRVMTISIERSAVVAERPGVDPRTGSFTWKIQAVASLGQEGTRDRVAPKPYDVKINVVRVPLSQDVRGVRISFISFKPRVASSN